MIPSHKENLKGAAFFLVGPTAVGKSAVAHHIAKLRNYSVLTADAMQVYRGMNIGTAKPTSEELAEVHYGGIDLVNPDEMFSVGHYLNAARDFIQTQDRQVIVAGGSGLYIKCLIAGLDTMPVADSALREEAETIMASSGVEGLQAKLAAIDPKRLAELSDKFNPRRLIRALELAHQGANKAKVWGSEPKVPLVGLRMSRELLHQRIEQRVHEMYAGGLLAEVEQLRRSYSQLSTTALQAIGYHEALEYLAGRYSLAEAQQVTIQRTRQLAKRQMTWFRHQVPVAWVDVESGMKVAAIAEQVVLLWQQHGPAFVILPR